MWCASAARGSHRRTRWRTATGRASPHWRIRRGSSNGTFPDSFFDADKAQFNWVGGPLDGTYTSADARRGAWEKFSKSQGPMKVSVDKLEESSNPKGSTVSANVEFEGKAPVKVRPG